MFVLRVGAVSPVSNEADCLRAHSVNVDHADSARDALDYLRLYEYDLILLSFALPDVRVSHALELLRQINSRVPVIVLSRRTTSSIRGQVLDRGADDFITGPIAFIELLARMRAVVRRSQGRAAAHVTFANVTVNQVNRTFLVRGKRLPLLPSEFRLVEVLLTRVGRVVPTTDLLRLASLESEGSLRTTLSRLRAKLTEAGSLCEIRRASPGYTIDELAIETARRELPPESGDRGL